MRHSVCLLLIALFASVAPLQAMANDIPDDVKVRCKADYSRLCSGVMPGGGRILACFQAHKAEVSPDCADALSQMKK
ncbi:MAG: hypothetical protein CTY30_02530 [Methylocystis sp.]|nr:MAG: hypothetical protein CTY30_02530 [Methylocystis sp.]